MDRAEIEKVYSDALARYANKYPEEYENGTHEKNLFLSELVFYQKELLDIETLLSEGEAHSIDIEHKRNCNKIVSYLKEMLLDYFPNGLSHSIEKESPKISNSLDTAVEIEINKFLFYANEMCFDLIDYLIDCGDSATKVAYMNIWYYLKHKNPKPEIITFSFTQKVYAEYILLKYGVSIIKWGKSDYKFDEVDAPALSRLLAAYFQNL